MSDCALLVDNIDKIHTTEMGIDRIKKNLKLDDTDVVEYCKDLIMDENCHIYRQGKNWYCEIGTIKLLQRILKNKFNSHLPGSCTVRVIGINTGGTTKCWMIWSRSTFLCQI